MTSLNAKLAVLVEALEDDHVFDAVAGQLFEARERGPRLRDFNGDALDRDGGEILEEMIRELRSAAQSLAEQVPA